MKRIYNIFFIILVTAILASCKKELTSEGVSRITTYPTITVKGDVFMSVNKGATFTDPGYIAKVGSEDVTSTVVVDGKVNTNTPGVYILSYTVTNSDGFPASGKRWVGVIDVDAQAQDISGTYVRTNGQPVTITKKGLGMYTTNNVGGVPGNPAFIYDVYFYNTAGNTLVVPLQPDALGGEIYCDNITFTGTVLKWVVHGGSYGTSVRTFNKQ
jgi:hypothetical protein